MLPSVLSALSAFLLGTPALALPPPLWGEPTCAISRTDQEQKAERLLTFGLNDPQYQATVVRDRDTVATCRAETWPADQGLWLRLYDSDADPVQLADVFDRIVNRGYNRVFVEVFYDGRVLLPVAENQSPWRSVTEEAVAAGAEDVDIWQMAVELGQERGLSVIAWAFALNFGYSYSQDQSSEPLWARNGFGESSISNAQFDPVLLGEGRAFYEDPSEAEHLFIDPYHPQAQQELADLLVAINARQPDGLVLDYVRYPTTPGRDTLINDPRQLWIYGEASQAALQERLNDLEWQLMQTYLSTATITTADVDAAVATYPDQVPQILTTALAWEGYLWRVASEHAYQGVLNFVSTVTTGLDLPIGTVFFPQGDRTVLQAGRPSYDARMQPWSRFPANFERHPMSYAICPDGRCVADQIATVRGRSPDETLVCPIVAGTWGQAFGGHIDLETKVAALEDRHADLSCVSHFVYSWMEPDSDRQRKAGTGRGQRVLPE